MYKTERVTCTEYFILSVIQCAKENGKRETKGYFGLPPAEKIISEWRKQKGSLQQSDKDIQDFHMHNAKRP